MSSGGDAKRRAIETAKTLFRAQGYAATGLTQILEESGAPKGSFYFHFPGGKHQLALAALNAYGARVEQGLQQLAAVHAGDPAAFVRALCRSIGAEMKASDWRSGCLAQNLASELAPADAVIAEAVAEVFRAWIKPIAGVVQSATKASEQSAERSALALLAGLEGARNIARVSRSPDPFSAVAEAWIRSIVEFDAAP